MRKRETLGVAVFLCLAFIGQLSADEIDQPISPAQRHAVVQALAARLLTHYVFSDVASRTAAALVKKEASGGYASETSADAFSEALTNDLRDVGKDRHFKVSYDPDIQARSIAANELPTTREKMASVAYGFQRIERLPGNVGYIELREFGPTELVSAAYASAIGLMAGTDALILDLRRNGGGESNSVAHLMSYFFAQGEQRHLNDLYTRMDDSTHQFWTDPGVSVRYDKPVYLLTSAGTFSAAEECAYDFQTQKRGIVVGENTAGGAHEPTEVSLGSGFIAYIPTARSINPITHTNWERVGVKPDIAAPAEKALQVAHAAILRTLISDERDSTRRDRLQGLLSKVEKGESDRPNYTLRY